MPANTRGPASEPCWRRSLRALRAEALRLGIEPEFARQVVRQRNLAASAREPHWPGPIRVYALGTLRIEALALYETGLSQDPLAEDLYQGAIRCHLAAGRAADALRAYRRCREQLSIVLGVSPFTATSELVAAISAR